MAKPEDFLIYSLILAKEIYIIQHIIRQKL